MTLPRKDPPPGGRAGPARAIPVQRRSPAGLPAPGTVHVEDHLESRVRIPADLLRCVIALIEIGLLVGLGLLARATANGAETDIVLASQRLPAAVRSFLGFAGHVALLILPVALAIRLLVRRQPRRLAEGVVAGGLTVALVLILNLLLRNHGRHGPVRRAHRQAHGHRAGARARLVPVRPDRLRHGHRPDRPPAVAGRVLAGHRLLRGWPAWPNAQTTVFSLLITAAAGHRVRGRAAVRAGRDLRAPVGGGDRRGARHGGPAGHRHAPDRGPQRGDPPVRRAAARRRRAGRHRLRPRPAGGRRCSTGCTAGCGCARRCRAAPR